MRRIGLGRCTRRRFDATDHADAGRDELRRADEALDAIGARERVSSDDPVLRALGALAADVDEDLPPRSEGVPKRRRLVSRAVLTTGLTVVALSGTGMAAATVVAGGVGSFQPIQAVQGLYQAEEPAPAGPTRTSEGTESSPRDVEGALHHSWRAVSAGDLAEAQKSLREARSRWQRLDTPNSGLAYEISSLQRRIANERPGGSPAAEAPATSPSGSAAAGSASATPTQDTPGETTPAETPTASPVTDPAEEPTARPHNGEEEDRGTPSPRDTGAGSPSPSPASPSRAEEPSGATTDGSARTHRSRGPEGSGETDAGDDARGPEGHAPVQPSRGVPSPGVGVGSVPSHEQD